MHDSYFNRPIDADNLFAQLAERQACSASSFMAIKNDDKETKWACDAWRDMQIRVSACQDFMTEK